MAASANRAALQTALLSVRGLRRRRLGHIGPNHYPQNDLDKWGRKTNGGGAPANLLGLNGGGGGRRPAPRASLVLGGERPLGRRRNGANGATNGLNLNGANANGLGDRHCNGSANGVNGVNGNGKRLGAALMERQRASMAHRGRVDDRPSSPADGGPAPAAEERTSPGGGYPSDLVVVLDMDECLIHSQFLSDQLAAPGADKYRQVEERPSSSSGGGGRAGRHEEAFLWSHCDSFRVKLPDGDLVNVNKRPNLDLFLREITGKFETYVFTAAMKVYAKPVLDRLDPNGTMFAGRYYREHCSYDPDMGVYAKNLCDVLRMRKMTINDDSSDAISCDERRVVLVDNNPLSFLPNPSNGILVSSFYDDPKDDTLEAVMELLHELDESDDVRPILDGRFGLREALEDVAKGPFGW